MYMFYAYTYIYVHILRRWCFRDSRFLVPRPGRKKERGLVHIQYRAVRKRQLLDATVRDYGGPIDNFAELMSSVLYPSERIPCMESHNCFLQ